MIGVLRLFRIGTRIAEWATPHVKKWHRERHLNRTEGERHLKASNFDLAEKTPHAGGWRSGKTEILNGRANYSTPAIGRFATIAGQAGGRGAFGSYSDSGCNS